MERVYCFLKHPLLISENDIRCFNIDQSLQAVISDNNPSVEVVQIGGCKPASLKWNQGTQLWRNDWNDTLYDALTIVLTVLIGCTDGVNNLTVFQLVHLS